MNRKKVHAVLHSVTFQLLVGIFLIIIPIISLLILSNFQSRNTLIAQIKDARRSTLHGHMSQIDSQMSGAMAYTINLALNENDVRLATHSTDTAAAQYARVRLQKGLEEYSVTNPIVDGVFLLLAPAGEEPLVLSAASRQHPAHREMDTILSLVKENKEHFPQSPYVEKVEWTLHSSENTQYLIQLVPGGEQIIAGSFINLSRLLAQLSEQGESISSVPIDQLEQALTSAPKGFQPIGVPSTQGPFALTLLLDTAEILESLPFMERYTVYLAILLILMVPLMLLIVNRVVTKPLQRLTGAMERIQAGNLDHRLEPDNAPTEIQMVNNAFNHMIHQVQHLKISIYEKELQEQRTQLRNLQLQIRPHFLINSLNMIYNAMENENFPMAQQLLLHVVDYFRYMVNADKELVPLDQELAHVKTYLEIQSLRYKEQFRYQLLVDPMIEDMLVPPLLVQTFVENIMQHVIRMEDEIEIKVQVSYVEKDYYPFGKIIISDTGSGYPIDLLAAINRGERIIDQRGEHIGIYNATRRLDLQYEGKASWRFYNDGGAVSELVLPALFDEREEG